MLSRAQLRERLRRIKLLVTDVDGVLTDGRLHYGAQGETDKAFHVRDGKGIRLLIEAGVEVAVITARRSEAVERRMAELGVDHCVTGCSEKGVAIESMFSQLGVSPEETAYVGDDVQDLPALEKVGLAVTVADGHSDVKANVDWITQAHGGHGVIREIADTLLASRGECSVEPFYVVIPSRFGSTRLEGKPLRLLAGLPMIEHVWRRAQAAGAAEVIVATDDERIRSTVQEFGGVARMTSSDHPSGTDRLAEVARAEGWADDVVVVNLQGDEPCVPGELVAAVARALFEHPNAGVATMATPVRDATELFDPNVVKVVCNDEGLASYFSRAPIPWVRDDFDPLAIAGGEAELPDGTVFLRHIGMYAYRVGALRRIARAPVAATEQAERLEQLRALALGIPIHVTVVKDAPLAGVDTEEDLARLEQVLAP
ncbi:MAG: 3-deoxy-manno-octulosonate cytidylyltransferase [Polyangiaceae bacterium]